MTDSANPATPATPDAAERAVHIRNNANGAEYVLRTAEAAQRIYPEFEILHYEDGGLYPDPVETGPNLKTMTRDELNAHGDTIGFPDAAGFSGTKAELIDAFGEFGENGPGNGADS